MTFNILGIFLSAIGAISGCQYLLRLWRRRIAGRRYRRAIASKNADLRYIKLDLGARIGEKGLSWHVLRGVDLVSEVDALDHVEVSGNYYDLAPGSFRHSVEPSGLTLVVTPSAHPRASSVHIHFPKLVRDGESFSYQYIRDFRKLATRPKEDCFLGTTSVPCELLVIRIVFDGWLPSNLRYNIMSSSGADVAFTEPVTPDPLSFEVRREIPYPTPTMKYGFTWSYPGELMLDED